MGYCGLGEVVSKYFYRSDFDEGQGVVYVGVIGGFYLSRGGADLGYG